MLGRTAPACRDTLPTPPQRTHTASQPPLPRPTPPSHFLLKGYPSPTLCPEAMLEILDRSGPRPNGKTKLDTDTQRPLASGQAEWLLEGM